MERNKILKIINQIFIDVLEDEIEVSEETSAADIEGWDSLTHIILIVETEKKFNVKFNSKEISNWKNVGEMILSIESKI